MLDKKKLVRKCLFNIITYPATLFPLLGGVTLGAMWWAFGGDLGRSTALAGISVLLAAGIAVTRAVVWREEIARAALNEMKEEAEEAADSTLDNLHERLVTDGDPRTQQLLQDMRTLVRVFKESGEWLVTTGVTLEILSKVDELFDSCVRLLEATLRLYNVAQRIDALEFKQPLLDRRETIVGEVEETVRQLSGALAEVQTLEADSTSDAQLARVRSELDTTLDVARRTNERVKGFYREFGLTET